MKSIRNFFPYMFGTLVGASIPVWLTLLLTVGGAYIAYYLAPNINEKFEIQAAKKRIFSFEFGGDRVQFEGFHRFSGEFDCVVPS